MYPTTTELIKDGVGMLKSKIFSNEFEI